MGKIKASCLYHDYVYTEIKNGSDIHEICNKLIIDSLEKYQTRFDAKQRLQIFYDKVSYKIDLQNVFRKFPSVTKFEMVNSKRSPGIQAADWIANSDSLPSLSSSKRRTPVSGVLVYYYEPTNISINHSPFLSMGENGLWGMRLFLLVDWCFKHFCLFFFDFNSFVYILF